ARRPADGGALPADRLPWHRPPPCVDARRHRARARRAAPARGAAALAARTAAALHRHGLDTPEMTDRRHPTRERAHFQPVAAARGDLYGAERTAAGRRRRDIRSGLLAAAAAAGLGDDARILDIGCGIADYTGPFARRTGAIVVGVDLTPLLLALARPSVP